MVPRSIAGRFLAHLRTDALGGTRRLARLTFESRLLCGLSCIRADAAFAMPEIYTFLEAEGFKYAIRLPANPRQSRRKSPES